MNSDLKDLANRVLERCDSTNLIARKLAEEGFPHGTWVSTKFQEAGKGRLGRKWESVEGNLFLSIVIKDVEKSLWSWLPLVVAVSSVGLLRETFTGYDFRIKWPNDIWYQGAKLGGILCEGVASSHRSYVIVGIGLNCVGAPQGLDQLATSLTEIQNGMYTDANQIRDRLRIAVLEGIELLKGNQVQSIVRDYESWAAFPKGLQIQWGASGQRGWIEGLGTSGELLVTNEAGDHVSLFAEDIQKVRSAG